MAFINREPPPNDSDSDAPFRRSLEHLSEQLASRRPEAPTHIDAPVRDPDEPPRGIRPALKVVAATMLAIAIVATIYSFRQTHQIPAAPKVAEAHPVAAPVETKHAQVPAAPQNIAPPSESASPPAAPAPQQATAPPAPRPTPLDTAGIREVQTRLRSLGIDPGPVDGVMGPRTERAVRSYIDRRGKGPLGLDSELLKQLRQDDSTNLAQHR
jgi:hypothetical protein